MEEQYRNGEPVLVLRSGVIVEDPELSRKLQIIGKRKPEKTTRSDTGYSWDESGMADLFAECYDHDTRYCAEAKSWYTYDRGAWRRDAGGLLAGEKIREFYRLMYLYCLEIEDEELKKKYSAFVLRLGDRRFRDRLMKDAQGCCRITAAEFDAKPYLINCLNGTYDLRTMEFREHDWRDYLTMQTRVNFSVNDDIVFPRWEKFIEDVTEGDRDKADYLQRALGYSILGSAKEECMFILHGKTTRNGKSTLLGAITHLLGDYASVSPVSIICKSDRAKNAEAASPVLASLKGIRFVSMAESNQYGRLDEEAIKQLTGGEEISARNLYEAQMTYLPQFTLWLSCNDLPSVQDKSLFASDRVRVIEFNRHFSDQERDETLKDVFKTEDAMRGIFSWLLKGYGRYKRKGLVMCPEMKKVIYQYEKDNDLVLQFLEDNCTKDPNGKIKTKDLYEHFKIWCRSNGCFIMAAKKFHANMETHPEWHEGRVKMAGYPYYKGISLKIN